MPKKNQKNEKKPGSEVVYAPSRPQYITDAIVSNYMPYAMSVIVSRAIPEIDGFKPSHRKLLYSMYKMGLMNSNAPYTKSSTVVGQAMHLNPHGDASIYETMVRLTRGHDALLHPFIDSKGSFGKHYSSDMAYAASRYTNVRLDQFCNEIFDGIDKDAVDMIPNYDNTTEEPTLLPTTFPNILVSANSGIAVGLASNICSFNLAEICDATVLILKRPHIECERLLDVIKGPDFSCGGYLIYDREALKEIYETGHGSFRLRSRYVYDSKENCIDILEIPYSTSLESILDKIAELVKDGKLKEIVDFRDETDLDGFKLTIDLRRGADPEMLMRKLFKLTTLEDTFGCNFNVLIDGSPRLLGIKGILEEWISFRLKCLGREMRFELNKLKDKLHLLVGLAAIMLDIDLAIKIIRDTKLDKDVVPNLMTGFDIDEIQAEYVANIRLRSLNHEYITGRISEITELQEKIAEIEAVLSDESKMKAIIIEQLTAIKKKYGKKRKTDILLPSDVVEYNEEDYIENYDAKLYLTEQGYFKKIKLASLRMSDAQALKEGDAIRCELDSDNNGELLFFTDKGQIYRSRVSEFEVCKASVLGEFIAAKLSYDENEHTVGMLALPDIEKESGNIVYVFKNGKAVKIPIDAYKTKAIRKKLVKAFYAEQETVGIYYETEPLDILLVSDNGRALVVNTSELPIKSTRTSCGVTVMTLKAKHYISSALNVTERATDILKRYRKNIPSSGANLTDKDAETLSIPMSTDN